MSSTAPHPHLRSGHPTRTRLAALAHLCLPPPTASEAGTSVPFATPVKVGKRLRWTWPDQLHLPRRQGSRVSMRVARASASLHALQPPPWASSLHVGSHAPASVSFRSTGLAFPPELSSHLRSCCWGRLSHPGTSSQVPRLALQVERGNHLGQRLASSV